MIDIRVPPGITLAELEASIDERVGAVPGCSWRRVKAWEANWSGLEVPFVRAFADVVGEVRRRPAEPTVRLPASDASRWRALGVPAVCYGPQPTLSAGLDDYAEEQDVVDCVAIYALSAWGFLAGGGADPR
jgi:succinyl-diaminopimelate desuccinylase